MLYTRPLTFCRIGLCVVLASVAACGDIEFVDEGRAYVMGRPASAHRAGGPALVAKASNPVLYDFIAEEPLHVEVELANVAACHGGDREAKCRVRLKDQRVIISASGSVEVHSGWGWGACNDEDILVQATCESPPLPAGTYDVIYGSYETVKLVVPSRGEALELGESPN